MYERLTLVVGAVIEKDGKVLLGRKEIGEHPAGIGGEWILPTGKVESGEKPEDALKREMQEELNCDVEVGKLLGISINRTFFKGKQDVAVLFFYEAKVKGEPRAGSDLIELKWVEKGKVLKELGKTFLSFYLPSFGATSVPPSPYNACLQLTM